MRRIERLCEISTLDNRARILHVGGGVAEVDPVGQVPLLPLLLPPPKQEEEDDDNKVQAMPYILCRYLCSPVARSWHKDFY